MVGNRRHTEWLELYFPNQSEMEKTLASPEAQTTIADLPNFASGGVAMIIGAVEG